MAKKIKKVNKKSDKFGILKAIIGVLVLIVIAGLGYSLYAYYTSGAAEEGIIVCGPDNPEICTYQDHRHVLIVPEVCGDERRIPIEKGDLDQQHSHEESNVIHWHDSIPIYRETGKFVNPRDLQLVTLFEQVEILFNQGCFYEYCNGNLCPDGSQGAVKIYINKNGEWEQNEEFENYLWEDGDVIYISFDTRSDEEILNYLRTSNIAFPFLGLG